MALSAGTRLGPYEILSKIGAGGMGEVYKARDTRLGRMVAIKILPPEKLTDENRQRRFEQEAIAASALNHPNIVTVYDVGTQDGLAFLAMELISGKSLDQSIPASGMRIGEILRVASQIADALALAHANGIVHRDLKPANVMITAEGLVKVLDFGLAKVTQSPEGADAETRTIAGFAGHTDAGTVLGTAAYMSPEQTEGKPVDARSDIFALGSLLYEMATGQRAFYGGTAMSTMSAVLRDDPPSCDTVRADLPPQLARVIARCLRKDPARRFQHMADLKVELDDLKQESDSGKLSSPSPAAPARTSRTPMWLAVAASAAIAALLGYRILPERAAVKPLPPAAPAAVASAPAPVEAPAPPSKAVEKPQTPPEPIPPPAPVKEVQETPRAKAAYDEGMLLIDQQKPAEAVPHFDDAIRANPNFLAAYLGRAEARRQTGQYESSLEDCNRVLQFAPQDARAYFCRGLGEALLEQYDLTVRDDTEAIRINPDFVLAYQGRGNAYNNLQQYDRAAADFTEAIRIRPNNGQFYLRRAGIYEKLQQYAKAIQDYDQAIRLQPGNARAYKGRANAKKLSGDGRGAEADRRMARQLKEQ
jgi:tetratricopeptide (TPR) repeat protein